MTKSIRGLALTALLGATAITAAPAFADCGIGAGRVSIVGNEFPAIQSVAAKAAECAGGGVEVKANLTADHQKINVPGMQGNPAEYTSAIVATSSIVALMNEDVIRPLDDLVAAHGADIPKNQLITVDGQVKAVAFMANAQHLIYRADILEKAGVAPPKTYEEFLAAAEKIRADGLMPHPVAGTYMAGWNLANEFINMYQGHGGAFFKDGSAETAINGPEGLATLEMMKKLTEYMNPDFLTHDSNALQAEWKAGNVALANFWGSRAINLTVAEGSTPEVYENTKVGAPMTVGGGAVPATSLWWDGWTVAKNISDDDAAATFKALAHGSSPALLNDTTMTQAVWMIPGFVPSEANMGVMASIEAGSRPYPMLPYMGLLHTALGDNIPNYLQGKASAQDTLAAIEAAYTSAAREKGFLK
ncbi:MAG TPA: extracellular solute-binding protein [Paracoccaceae bacterium]|nr:extracellular solute-binding protein [Paracoccaceae bacterium]